MGKQTTELPEVMQTIAETIAAGLLEDGLADARAIELGLNCAAALMHTFGGECIYIPKGIFAEYTRRDIEIATMMRHASMREVCEKYGITSRRVYQILQAVRDGQEKPEQLELFGCETVGENQ